MAKKYVDRNAALGRKNYLQVIDRIIKDRVCPFCEEHFLKYHTKPILKRGSHWLLTKNMNPYAGTKHHFLFVHRRHIENPTSMSDAAWKELLAHIRYVVKKFKLPGGGLYVRFGDPRYSAASVAHLHANVILGTKRGKHTEPIGVDLSYKKKRPRF